MSEPQAVYEPGMWPDFYGTDRHAEFLSWLKANGIDPEDVSAHTEVTVETTSDGARLVRYSAFLRNEDGAKYVDEATGEPAQWERIAPVQVEPPMHWYVQEVADV